MIISWKRRGIRRMNDQLLYQIALTLVDGVKERRGRELINRFGDAKTVFSTDPVILRTADGIGKAIADNIANADVLKRAEKEVSFIEKNNIRCSFITDDDYPAGLKKCRDAPLMIYMMGKMDFRDKRLVSIVGSRHATSYGQNMVERFVCDLAAQVPNVLIVSGLAYGIDVHAHKCALKENIPTVGVLAHGLDRIYPGVHRDIAVEMLKKGGLLTEYMSETEPHKPNFLIRNRIIAGLADATVVVESAYKGGSLNTAAHARDYGKDVFAFPGRATDKYSQGCNRIITNDTARLISNADDFILAMLWDVELKPKPPKQQTLNFSLEGDHALILEAFKDNETIDVDTVARDNDIPLERLKEVLFDLEMEGVVQPLSGNCYKLV